MKKIILLLLFITAVSMAQNNLYIHPAPVPSPVVSDTANIARLNRDQTFTGINTFQGATIFTGPVTANIVTIDSLLVNYIRDTNLAVVGTAVINTLQVQSYFYPNYDTMTVDGAGGITATVNSNVQNATFFCTNFLAAVNQIITITYNNNTVVASSGYKMTVSFPLNALSPYYVSTVYFNGNGRCLIEFASTAGVLTTDNFQVTIEIINFKP